MAPADEKEHYRRDSPWLRPIKLTTRRLDDVNLIKRRHARGHRLQGTLCFGSRHVAISFIEPQNESCLVVCSAPVLLWSPHGFHEANLCRSLPRHPSLISILCA